MLQLVDSLVSRRETAS